MLLFNQHFRRWSCASFAKICKSVCLSLGLMLTGCQAMTSISAPWFTKAEIQNQRIDVPPLGMQPESKPAVLPKDKAAQACLLVAESLEANQHYREAAMQYELARQYQPQTSGLERKLGRLYDQIGEHDKSIAEYEKALKNAPNDAELMNDIGYVYWRKGQGAEAEKWFKRALAKQPQLKRAQINLALAIGQQGRFDECLKAFQVVLPEADSHCNLAFVYLQCGKVNEARREYQIALTLNPQMQFAKDRLADVDRVETKMLSDRQARLSKQNNKQNDGTFGKSISANGGMTETIQDEQKQPQTTTSTTSVVQVEWRPSNDSNLGMVHSSTSNTPPVRLGLPQQRR